MGNSLMLLERDQRIRPTTDQFIVFAGLGASQTPMMGAAIAMGYGVRIGIEDNIWYDQKKTQLASNSALLRRVHQLMEIHERELMTAKDLGNHGFYNARRNQPAGV